MAFSSIAIVAGVAALSLSLFKNKELRVKDIVDLSKVSKEDIENNPQLKIAKNDINAHITGIKDPIYHEALIEIMARYNKSVDYFSKLDGRLTYSGPYHISIVKLSFRERLKKVKDTNSVFASFSYISGLLSMLVIAIIIDDSSLAGMQTAAIILAILIGMTLAFLLRELSVQWSLGIYQERDYEYQKIFDEYANHKIDELGLGGNNNVDE